MVGPTLSLFSHLDTKPQLTLEIKRREIFKCQVTGEEALSKQRITGKKCGQGVRHTLFYLTAGRVIFLKCKV